jgi:hypothetical protein
MNWFSSEFKIDDDTVAKFVKEALNNNTNLCSLCDTIKYLNTLLKNRNCISYFNCYNFLNNNNKQLLSTLVPTYLAYAQIDNNPYRDEKKYIESLKPKLDSSKFSSDYNSSVIASTPYRQGIRAGGRKRSRRDRKSKKSRRTKKSRSRRSRRRKY